jgi:hypothetical protein
MKNMISFGSPVFIFAAWIKGLIGLLGLISLIGLVGGCGSSQKYYWGSYEQLIYDQYDNPGKASPEIQIHEIEKDIQVARSKDKPLPPGLYAHLGYQYLQAGKADQALVSFETEKRLFPESSTLMNRFIKRLKGK